MIDWQFLTLMLRQHYKPLSVVATESGSCMRHLNRLARGEISEPRFNTGVRILDLAHDVLPAHVWARIKAEAAYSTATPAITTAGTTSSAMRG